MGLILIIFLAGIALLVVLAVRALTSRKRCGVGPTVRCFDVSSNAQHCDVAPFQALSCVAPVS